MSDFYNNHINFIVKEFERKELPDNFTGGSFKSILALEENGVETAFCRDDSGNLVGHECRAGIRCAQVDPDDSVHIVATNPYESSA